MLWATLVISYVSCKNVWVQFLWIHSILCLKRPSLRRWKFIFLFLFQSIRGRIFPVSFSGSWNGVTNSSEGFSIPSATDSQWCQFGIFVSDGLNGYSSVIVFLLTLDTTFSGSWFQSTNHNPKTAFSMQKS